MRIVKQRGRPARRQAQVLQFVGAMIASDGIAPSYGMICDQLGIQTRTEVCRIIARLERAGALSRVGSGRVRRIRLGATM